MFPISDVDLSIIEINKIKNFKNIETFISYMWDQGYKIGHSDIDRASKKYFVHFGSGVV